MRLSTITNCIAALTFSLLVGCAGTAPRPAVTGAPIKTVENESLSSGITADVPEHSIISIATSLEGIRYHYGGISPRSGFDCSGFMFYIHHQIGIELPRTSSGQFRYTSPVSRQALRPGDLVFFGSRRGRINHVGLYLGSNRFIHAPGKGKFVSVSTLDHPYWQPRFVRGGRI